MNLFVKDNILHVVFNQKQIPPELDDLGTLYEGKVPNRIGVNLPMYVLRQTIPDHPFCEYLADYIIIYPDWDKTVRDHEALHAKYFLDKEYRKSVQRHWKKCSARYQAKVFQKMKSMGYPEEVWLDEWQAYLLTGELKLSE